MKVSFKLQPLDLDCRDVSVSACSQSFPNLNADQ